MKIISGDVTKPISGGLICHIVNDLKLMGSGVALALLNKWGNVKADYLAWDEETFKLGNVQFVQVEDNIQVVNMIAQHQIKGYDKNATIPPIRYEALRNCLKSVADVAKNNNYTVHLPYLMGCDRAGGNWDIVTGIINKELCEKNIEVIVYKL